MVVEQRTYLIEECVVKQVFRLPKNHPLWEWFDAEGPVIRMVGDRIQMGDGFIVTFRTQFGDVTFDEEVVQEVFD